MIRFFGPAIAVFLMVGIVPAADKAKEDLDKMQGEWRLDTLQIDGEDTPSDAKDSKIVIKDKRLTVVLKGPMGKEEKKSMTFELDPTKKPKTIDMMAEEGPDKKVIVPGIYELDGDTLRICSANPPKSKDRPTDFTVKKGSGLGLLVLKRIKDKGAKEGKP